ncbi:hypothetical protein ACJ72_08507 [Emergomyces africanus]|uniref:F-box domain-containing protein n=1 Tax=Emergomyces africanus TaxID=1955775 RepID=A0A1B7NKP8_9EURO|nr:hypothetical protein ACJ72_08507 [Emergomyces africanus]
MPTNQIYLLPPEIVCAILSSLPDFTALFSAIQSHRFFYDTFATDNNGLSILRSIFQRKCFLLKTGKYGSVLRDLVDIMRYAVVRRDWARGIFEECWGCFTERGLEEMLIPIGMAWAWSLINNPPGQGRGEERKQHLDEAVDLLEDIWKGSAPFGWTQTSQSFAEFPLKDEDTTVPAWPSIYPLAASLVKLYAMLPEARDDNSDDDDDNSTTHNHDPDEIHINSNSNNDKNNDKNNNNNSNSNVRLLVARENILKTLRPHYDNLDVAVVAGIDIYCDTRIYLDEYGDLARNGFQFMNKPTPLEPGGGGWLTYSARPAGNFFMFWMRVGNRPRFLPRDRLSSK